MRCADCNKPIRTAKTVGRLPERCPEHRARRRAAMTTARVRRFRARARAAQAA